MSTDNAETAETATSLPLNEWLKLTDKKDFSRLLYTNPVCFLSLAPCPRTNDESSAAIVSTHQINRNVMVLSWLTATNNSGRFMFSLNKWRHSASTLVPTDSGTGRPKTGVEFVLSVPVKGMEQLVLNVGSTSGKWGSKFQDDYSAEGNLYGEGECANNIVGDSADAPNLSNRQKKKLKRQQFAKGVPHLVGIPFGCSDSSRPCEKSSDHLVAIQGTCAHLKCHTYNIVSAPEHVIDENHHLVMAEVTSAFVHSSYWDSSKNQFRPMSRDVSPYLTFFGSQKFGYICDQSQVDHDRSV